MQMSMPKGSTPKTVYPYPQAGGGIGGGVGVGGIINLPMLFPPKNFIYNLNYKRHICVIGLKSMLFHITSLQTV